MKVFEPGFCLRSARSGGSWNSFLNITYSDKRSCEAIWVERGEPFITCYRGLEEIEPRSGEELRGFAFCDKMLIQVIIITLKFQWDI